MSKLFIQFVLFYSIFVATVKTQLYNEKYRLKLHYSVPIGWGNDPNGLIFFNGYYHLFYQYNPNDIIVASIHWGHARSKDLINWENLPIALKPYDNYDIFSGCCVLDRNNATVFTSTSEGNENQTLIAIFSLNKNNAQSQGMAYSFDNGINWTMYDQNPILPNPNPAKQPDFRDPNIIERNGNNFMVLAVKDRISFYGSRDYKNWYWLSDFGVDSNEGDKCMGGVWECPSIFSLKDEKNFDHDVLIVSENPCANGSLLQYFVGRFDGIRFKNYNQTKVLWAENGPDNYAAVPYHNDPRGRIILIGWMSNWIYADKIPTSIWRGQYTIPRELKLKTVDGKLYLAQYPVDELDKQINQTWSASNQFNIDSDLIDLTEKIPFKTGSMLKMEYAINIGNVRSGKFGIQFSNNVGEFVSFAFDVERNTYEFDRTKSGEVSFHEQFADIRTAHRISRSKILTGIIILDVASIEIFADDGLNTFTALFFPTVPFENVQLTRDNDDGKSIATVQLLRVSSLNSIWLI